MAEHEEANPPLRKDWRFYAGLLSFGLAWTLPFFSLIVPSLGLSTTGAAFLTGFLLVGGPEILGVAAVVLLGKEFFSYLKTRIFGWLRDRLLLVSAPRYYFALTLVVGSSAAQWLGLYFPSLVAIDGVALQRVRILLDLVFLTGLVLAGEQFWDKLRRLFTYDVPSPESLGMQEKPSPPDPVA